MNEALKAHCASGRICRGYLMVGDSESSITSGREAGAAILGINEESVASHPDFSEYTFDSFGPDEIRELRRKSFMKPALAPRKVFSVSAAKFDDGAGHMLSRLLDDSPDNCCFLFSADCEMNLPEIIRAKLFLLPGKSFSLPREKKNFYEKFLKAGPAERLNLVKSISADKKAALGFLNELEVFLSAGLKKEKKLISVLGEINRLRRFLFDRAPSAKMIIEHFALTLPQF